MAKPFECDLQRKAAPIGPQHHDEGLGLVLFVFFLFRPAEPDAHHQREHARKLVRLDLAELVPDVCQQSLDLRFHVRGQRQER